MMDRRAFIGRMALGLAAVPIAVDAQQPAKVARIGYLATGPLQSPEQRSVFDAFREGMRELGYAEGRNIVVVVREADGKIERFPALARELVGLKVDVIVATNSLTGRAVRRATTRIPTIVQKAGTVHDALRTVALEEVTEVVTRKEIG
jgi:putative ABC transport system substrate-binding protein